MPSSYSQTVLEHLVADYGRMYHEPIGQFKLPYIVPGAGYEHCLWDWDTFFASRAILAIMRLSNAPEEMRTKMLGAMRRCILNFLSVQQPSGAMPFSVYLGAEHHFSEMIEKYDEPSNPSNWLGPVWLIVNYIVFQGLLNYGYRAEAEQLCHQTIDMLGRDIERFGGMHEYYVPETGMGVMNCGFMNWNYLAAEMMEAVGWIGLDAASRK